MLNPEDALQHRLPLVSSLNQKMFESHFYCGVKILGDILKQENTFS